MSPNIILKKLRDTEIKNAEIFFYTFKSRDSNLTLVQSRCDRHGRGPRWRQRAACTRSPSYHEDWLWGQRERRTQRSSMPARGSLPRLLSPWRPACLGQGPASRPACSQDGGRLRVPRQAYTCLQRCPAQGDSQSEASCFPCSPMRGGEAGATGWSPQPSTPIQRGRCALCLFPGKFSVELGFLLFLRQLGAQNVASRFAQAFSNPPRPPLSPRTLGVLGVHGITGFPNSSANMMPDSFLRTQAAPQEAGGSERWLPGGLPTGTWL